MAEELVQVQHLVERVVPLGAQELVPVEPLEEVEWLGQVALEEPVAPGRWPKVCGMLPKASWIPTQTSSRNFWNVNVKPKARILQPVSDQQRWLGPKAASAQGPPLR